VSRAPESPLDVSELLRVLAEHRVDFLVIGGVAAQVTFAGLVVSGEFQFNVVVPKPLSNGDKAITATYSGVSTQAGALISIQN